MSFLTLFKTIVLNNYPVGSVLLSFLNGSLRKNPFPSLGRQTTENQKVKESSRLIWAEYRQNTYILCRYLVRSSLRTVFLRILPLRCFALRVMQQTFCNISFPHRRVRIILHFALPSLFPRSSFSKLLTIDNG